MVKEISHLKITYIPPKQAEGNHTLALTDDEFIYV